MNAFSPIQTRSPNRVIIFDTTLRDGEQAPGYAMTLEEKIGIAKEQAAMGIDVIEAGFAASSPTDFKSVKYIAEHIHGPVIASLARAVPGDIEAAANALQNCERPRIHTFVATSPDHMKYKLGKTPEQVLESIDASVRMAADYMRGRGDVEWSAEDASRSSIDFLVEAVRTAINAGATTINLPDTVGYAEPGEYGAMFREVIARVTPSPDIIFSAHTHNDQNLAVENALAAVRNGARQVEVTINGVGERCGNASLETFIGRISNRPSAYPYEHNIITQRLKPVADMHRALFGPNAPTYAPFIGDNAAAHGSGIHQDGEIKGERREDGHGIGLYTIADMTQFGHAAKTLLPLTRHSGMAGVNGVLQHHGVAMTGDQLKGFMQIFNDTACDLLEERHMRIVPNDVVINLANRFMAGQLPAAQVA